MADRYFTPEEANALLPLLHEDLLLLQEMSRQFEDLYMALQDRKAELESDLETDSQADPYFEDETRLEFMRLEADLVIRRFGMRGVQLKMIDPGLIDFPAMLDGREVLLCWKQGEPRVSHYHGTHDGFLGRKSLPAE